MRETTLNRALARYEVAPHLVFWETTKACSLACRHCRASAQSDALPDELTFEEGCALIDQIAEMEGASPILVFTGGDCFERPDLFDLVAHARRRGLRLGVAPSVTDRLTRDSLVTLYELGVRSVSISLDGATPAAHDGVRGIPGHFERTVEALEMMRDLGFRLQVNTTVMRGNVEELADVASLLRRVGVPIWEVFFLVGVGRGSDVAAIGPREAEDVCHFLVDVTAYGLTVRTVEAPFYRRVQAERAEHPGEDPREWAEVGRLYDSLRARLDREVVAERAAPSATLATGDGRGVIFVGYDGEVHASGFLPVPLGNVRDESLGSIYTQHPLLNALRAGELRDACGGCDYRRLCGGSRARAYAHSGEVLGDDPSCVLTLARETVAAEG